MQRRASSSIGHHTLARSPLDEQETTISHTISEENNGRIRSPRRISISRQSNGYAPDTSPRDPLISQNATIKTYDTLPNRNPRHLSIKPLPHRSPSPDPEEEEQAVTWRSLPRKGQLLILTLARLSEPLTQTSLQAYLYYQLASFTPDAEPSTIATQAGIVQAAFPAAQALTAVLWGRLADKPYGGRKVVLVVGLLGTAVGSVGYGLAQDWKQAMAWRLVSGVLNGNVGVMRTMISEIVREKKYQSRAFLLLPMCFNVGVIIGPVLGGILADPVGTYPDVFGPGSAIGGADGVWWMRKWPYALPNMLSAIFLICSASCVILGLEETLEARRHKPDIGLRLGRSLASFFRRLFRSRHHGYKALDSSDPDFVNQTNPSIPPTSTSHLSTSTSKPKTPISFRKIWTRNVLTTLLSHALLSLGLGGFASLWFIFLSTPRSNESLHPSNPFLFSGGLSLPPSKVGSAMAILGVIGLLLQFLLYPSLSARLGTPLSYRLSLSLFPVVYVCTPFIALIPASAPSALLWMAISSLLALHVLARTFALPANIILVNSCAPGRSVLGTVHGVAQSVSSAARTVGPVAGGWIFGLGERIGCVGLAFWILAGVSVVGWLVGSTVKEGDAVTKEEEVVVVDEEEDDDAHEERVEGERSSEDGLRERNGSLAEGRR